VDDWQVRQRAGVQRGRANYVDAGNPSGLQLSGSATWSAWVNASATPRDDGLIVAKSQNVFGWQLKTSRILGHIDLR